MIRMALKPLVAACLLASLSTAPQAAPSPYSTLVVFGDSLSDAGQFPDPAGPAGSTSRFTNRVGPTYQNGSGEIFGPTAPMLLGNQLGIAPGDLAASTSPVNAQQGIADGNNWAVGGYRTDQIYDSITAANGSLIERDNTLLRSRDGYLVDRARQGLGADPNALYYITGGGNDFLQGRILNDVQAQQAAGRLVDSVHSQDSAASGDGNGYNLTLGGSYRIDEAWRAGVAAGFYRQKLEAGAKDSDYRMNSYMASAFVQYQENRWWADAALTGGYLDYDDLKRKFALGGGERSEKGDTNGHLWAFSARLGYDIAQQADSPWHLSPFVSADYARVEVDGYSEKSASATALDYDDQKRSSKRLGAGLQGKYAFGSDTQLFAEYAHEREYEDDTQDLTMSLNSLPGNRFTLEGYTPQDHLNRVSLGFSQKLAPELSLRGGYNWRKGEDDTQQSVSLALSLDF